LKIENQPREDHQVKIIAEFELEVFEAYKLKAARKISQDTKIPGFRPGKAPYGVVVRFFGEPAIEREATDLILEDKYPEVLKEAGVEPFGPGSLEEIISTNPPKYAFVVPLLPKVTLGEYQTIRKEFTLPEVADERVETVIRNLRASYSTATPVQRPVEAGDLALFSLAGTLAQAGEGEDAEVFKNDSMQMIVGENDLEKDDWPFEHFTENLVGMAENDEREFTHLFAEDDEDERVRGKEVTFKVQLVGVRSMVLPELNDEFAQSVGEYENLEKLRASIRTSLSDNDKREYENKYLTELVDQIRSVSTIKYPPQALAEESEQVLHSIQHDLEDRRMDLQTYLKAINKEKDQFIEDEVKPIARQRLERSLVMDELARAEEIKLDFAMLEQETNATMEALKQDPEFQKASKGKNSQNLARNITMEAANRVMNRQVMQRLKAIATGEAETVVEAPATETGVSASMEDNLETAIESLAPVEELPATEDQPASEEKTAE
jgi:trigger factor